MDDSGEGIYKVSPARPGTFKDGEDPIGDEEREEREETEGLIPIKYE